ncbi:hypothetical protein OPV22_013390 [Ensete ventricosum]|uniref:TCP domain-containing protein n=1 Tax=Ensete ventricosum TaxID=4639 RepID=A0AAV8R0R9_ENSVE|nr:hypothetical protein OPV22_013390 [Ensete ventricosum]
MINLRRLSVSSFSLFSTLCPRLGSTGSSATSLCSSSSLLKQCDGWGSQACVKPSGSEIKEEPIVFACVVVVDPFRIQASGALASPSLASCLGFYSEGSKEREKDLDPRRALYLPNSADPKESERGGGGRGIGGVGPRELQLATTASSSEYARLPEAMGEGHNHHSLGYNQLSLNHHHDQQQQQQQQLQRPQPRPRHGGGTRGGVIGEIVEVQGGHILRSIGRKDRHSKVCTAKGPRDRRVRLAAHTAIQFYDVQDRLGYDRPSKAVDWLIKNAKAAIDQLAELPPWSPSTTVAAAYAASSSRRPPLPPSSQSLSTDQGAGEPGNGPIAAAESVVSAGFGFGGGNENPSFLPPSLDTDSIADTIKLFFPVAAAAAAATSPSSSPSIGFQTYSPDVPSRTSSQVKDLRLSLQSFQDPIFPNPESGHHHHFQYHQSPAPPAHNAHFPGSAQIAFDAVPAGWAEQGQRIVPWNVVDSSGGGGGGYVFSFPPPQAVPLHSVLGQSQLFCQRGPLQSSNSPAIRAWADPGSASRHVSRVKRSTTASPASRPLLLAIDQRRSDHHQSLTTPDCLVSADEGDDRSNAALSYGRAISFDSPVGWCFSSLRHLLLLRQASEPALLFYHEYLQLLSL